MRERISQFCQTHFATRHSLVAAGIATTTMLLALAGLLGDIYADKIGAALGTFGFPPVETFLTLLVFSAAVLWSQTTTSLSEQAGLWSKTSSSLRDQAAENVTLKAQVSELRMQVGALGTQVGALGTHIERVQTMPPLVVVEQANNLYDGVFALTQIALVTSDREQIIETLQRVLRIIAGLASAYHGKEAEFGASLMLPVDPDDTRWSAKLKFVQISAKTGKPATDLLSHILVAGLHPEGTIRFSGAWDQGLVR